MILQIANVLDSGMVTSLREALIAEAGLFQPGAATAGWHARAVKNNEQSAGPAARRGTFLIRDTWPPGNTTSQPTTMSSMPPYSVEN